MIVSSGTPKVVVGCRPVVPVGCGCHEALPLLGGGVKAGNVVKRKMTQEINKESCCCFREEKAHTIRKEVKTNKRGGESEN